MILVVSMLMDDYDVDVVDAGVGVEVILYQKIDSTITSMIMMMVMMMMVE